MMSHLVRVLSVEPLNGFMVRITFEDGTRRDMNLEPFFHGPIFEPIRRNPATFRAMRVEAGTIVWPNGAGRDPDVLNYGLRPAWKEKRRRPSR
jgi:hypothetical protein